MSGKIVREVMECAPLDLSDSELRVLIALAEDASDKTRRAAHITIQQLAFRSRLAPGTVNNVLVSLRRRCLIQGTENVRPGNGRRQIYELAKLQPEHRTAIFANEKGISA